MRRFLERLVAQVAYRHADSQYRRFLAALRDAGRAQTRAMLRAVRLIAPSDFGREHRLDRVRTIADFRSAVPLRDYEALRPWIERVAEGRTGALFRPRERLWMFATTSGTTSRPKLIPVTNPFLADYRRGWNTFGVKMLTDHPRAVLRGILQGSGRHDAHHTAAGIPCGAITGLMARFQKRIVRRFYVGRPQIAHLPSAQARHYALMRLAAGRDVAFAITANPATLIEMARTADEHAETLIRDVRDGTLSAELVPDAALRGILGRGLCGDAARTRELEALRHTHGALRPRDLWRLEFLACWTGGSMGGYLDRLRAWWGDLPIRDVGLLASEGRVTIPLADNTPAGVLDVTSAFFEFIPLEEAECPAPSTLLAHELDAGGRYIVVLSNTSGLLRYRLDDVVIVRGRFEGVPLLEFLHRTGRVSSLSGEKLTENQVIAAVDAARRELGLAEFDFVLAPCWADPPFYRLSVAGVDAPGLAEALDRHLSGQNEEYESRRGSRRLGMVRSCAIPAEAFQRMDRRARDARGSAAEQYKRTFLFSHPGEDEAALSG